MTKEKKTSIIFFILSIIMFCIIFSLSCTNSPFYAFNPSGNCFFSVGKGVLYGHTLYKDIIAQKGLLTYIPNILGYLISNTTFFGVWIVHLISMIPCAILCYKTSNLFLKSPIKNCIATILFALTIFTSKAFGTGQIVEAYVLPLFMYSIYSAVKYYENGREIPLKSIFLSGIFCGIIFWMKYSLIAFYIGYMLYICIKALLKKDLKNCLLNGFIFLLGFILVTIPCVLYFVINNAVPELLEYYFFTNISGYGSKISILSLPLAYIKSIVKQSYWNLPLVLNILVSIIYLIKKTKKETTLILLSSFLVHFIIIFMHGPMFAYYLFAFAPFAIFAPLVLFELPLNFTCKKYLYVGFGAFCLLSIFATVYFLKYPRYFLKKQDELVQYRFAEYMNSKYDNPTLLNYGILDAGFFTAANIIPNTWSYCQLNWDRPEMEEDQLNSIKDKKVNFVIVIQTEDREIPKIDYLEENYNLVKTAGQYKEEVFYTYYLYEVK